MGRSKKVETPKWYHFETSYVHLGLLFVRKCKSGGTKINLLDVWANQSHWQLRRSCALNEYLNQPLVLLWRTRNARQARLEIALHLQFTDRKLLIISLRQADTPDIVSERVSSSGIIY